MQTKFETKGGYITIMAFRGLSSQLSLSRLAAVVPAWWSKELGRGESWGARALGFAWLNVMGSFPHWMPSGSGSAGLCPDRLIWGQSQPGSRRRGRYVSGGVSCFTWGLFTLLSSEKGLFHVSLCVPHLPPRVEG